MSKFTLHTPESAPEAARETLTKVQKNYGFLPNLLAGLAEAPAALHGYIALSAQYDKSSLTAQEQQVVLLAASVIKECGFRSEERRGGKECVSTLRSRGAP